MVVPLPSFVTVTMQSVGAKFARTVALPLVKVTVVLAEEGFAIVAVPLTIVQLENLYSGAGVADIEVAVPALTEIVPEGEVVPKVSLVKVSEKVVGP